ncbi:MAG: 2-oxoacid:acceptor oxidoreductase subunit alpha [Zestosphaera sp.]
MSARSEFMLGNHAIAEGAIAAGCRYYAAYPITPVNEISMYMSERIPQVGGIFIQSEDELFSIFSVIGASLAGLKAMTATASEGFNYMQEGLGYATAVEVPLVVVDAMRTRGENYPIHSDIMQVRWGPSGDYEAVVFAPSSPQECFDFMIDAFNVAEKYRTPVVVILEASIGLMREKVIIPSEDEIKPRIIDRKVARADELPPEKFLPYKGDEKGVPLFPVLGSGYRVIRSLNPHDERGYIAWSPEVFERMYKRIVGKIRNNADDIVRYREFYLNDADVVVASYGSVARVALGAVKKLRDEGIKVGLLKIDTPFPVPEKELRKVAESVKGILVPELNIGKYSCEVEKVVGCVTKVRSLPKNRGEQFTLGEIVSGVRRLYEEVMM